VLIRVGSFVGARAKWLGRSLALPGSLALPLLVVAAVAYAAGIPDFTFIQASDVHAPSARSKEVISKVASLSEIDMAAYGIKAPKPEFVIVTGDLTEFGGGSGWWEEYLSYWKDCRIPVYHEIGNHDNTWHAQINALRELGQGPWFSFDRDGCHFVGLMTPTIQDPRPSIGEEQIVWLKKDLASVAPDTPVFVSFHHPLGSTEFAGRYDCDRLLDVLREHNTVLLMAGHSHGFVSRPFEDFDQITGGSTNNPTPGLTFVSVIGGVVRAAYQKDGEPAANVKIIEKPIPAKSVYPKTEIVWPKPRTTTGATLGVAAYTTAEVVLRQAQDGATCTVDDTLNGDLHVSGSAGKWIAAGTLDTSGLMPGAHYLRVDFQCGDRHFQRSAEFFYEPADKPTAWRVYLGASTKCTPTVADGVVYVGANDGRLWAIEADTGKAIWTVETGAEIAAQPLVIDGKVIVANGLGLVRAYSTRAEKLWEFPAGDAVYSSPVLVEGKIAFGCNNGRLYVLDPSTGAQVSMNSDATYSVESKPFAVGGRVYYGAWDQYVRCVNALDGSLAWKQLGEGSRIEKAARYYSPADAGPVAADGKVFIADRDYMLTIINAETGERIDAKKAVAATGVSEDGKFVYLRKTDGNLEKIDSSGKTIWATPCHMGYIAAAPTETDGVVYVASGLGLVSAISAQDGKIIWQYQASPGLYVMSSVASDGKRAYVTSFDGMLTAIRSEWRPQP